MHAHHRTSAKPGQSGQAGQSWTEVHRPTSGYPLGLTVSINILVQRLLLTVAKLLRKVWDTLAGTMVVWDMYQLGWLVLACMVPHTSVMYHGSGTFQWIIPSVVHAPWYVTCCQGGIWNVPNAFFSAFSATWCRICNCCFYMVSVVFRPLLSGW